jgi:NADH dehydrogenase FAD-containing subunit
MASNRHLGRIVALQSLYEYEFRVQAEDKSVDIDDILRRNLERYENEIEDVDFVTVGAGGTGVFVGLEQHKAGLFTHCHPVPLPLHCAL